MKNENDRMQDFNDLLKHLHEQYAINVNSWNSTFVSLLVALFTLFGGYGVFYAKVKASKGDEIYTTENLLLLAGVVCCVDDISVVCIDIWL